MQINNLKLRHPDRLNSFEKIKICNQKLYMQEREELVTTMIEIL